MQCVRCQHPLPPRADRCLRCFALNPQNRPQPLAAATPSAPLGAVAVKPLGLSFESDPPPRETPLGALSIRSDPPPRDPAPDAPAFTPLDDPELSFDDPSFGQAPRLVIDLNAPRAPPPPPPDTEPSPPPSGMEPAPAPPAFSEKITQPQITPAPLIDLPPRPESRKPAPSADARAALAAGDADLPLAADPSAAAPERLSELSASSGKPAARARLLAWVCDGALVALASALFVALAAALMGKHRLAPLGAQSWESWADGLVFAHRLPIFWGLLCAVIALGYSWLFAALGGRTPGLRVAGLRLLREDGAPLDPVQALWRALFALPSAALCLFGFVLALFDARGQTLHDKLSRSLVVPSGAGREGSP